MIEKLYRIKPLEWRPWSAFGKRNGASLSTIAGLYTVWQAQAFEGDNQQRMNWFWQQCTTARPLPCESLETGKAACEAHWRARLEAVLEEVKVEN